MKHISLFSGIGGFDLAAEWMGWENIASCEINPFCNRILAHYWPDAYHHDDIHTLTFDLLNEKISKKYPDWQSDDIILTGGFPCQPYSQAGKRLGKEDSRHLWPEMLRVIREVRPRYIVGENVSGLVNWSDGLVFEEVQVDLENEGYEVQAFILPAAAVDAPHRRDRVWFIAQNAICNGCVCGRLEKERTEIWEQRNACAGNSDRICLQTGTASNANSNGQQRSNGEHEINTGQRGEYAQRNIEQSVKHGTTSKAIIERSSSQGKGRKIEGYRSENNGKSESWRESPEWNNGLSAFSRTTTNTNNQGCKRDRAFAITEKQITFGGRHRHDVSGNTWQNFPTQSPVCTGNDGISARLDGITFPKWRNESIKAAGNAIVPQVAFRIFQAIQTIHNQTETP
jgi:DNA (cytosine-5)-methyltransferase 1